MSFMIQFLDIVNIKGVDSYILARNDGRVVSHNVERPEVLSVKISSAGHLCINAKEKTGFSSFRYLILERDSERPLVVIPVGKYFLGVFSSETERVSEVAGKIMLFLKQILSEPGRERGGK